MDAHGTALIFGASGQDGFYLTRLLEQQGMRVVGVSRSSGPEPGDVADGNYVDDLVASVRPRLVFQLAAHSTTRHEALWDNQDAIVTGTWNVLEATARHCPEAKVFIPGSALQFENLGEAIDETHPFASTSAYAVARIQATHAARYFRQRGLRCYVGYLFHHESPLRTLEHVSIQISAAARRIAAGSDEALAIGNPNMEREWTFAGDMMQGILTLMQQEWIFEAVLGSGRTHSLRQWAAACCIHLDLNWRDHLRTIEGSRGDYARLGSNPTTMRRLGWSPTVGIRELAAMVTGSPTNRGQARNPQPPEPSHSAP